MATPTAPAPEQQMPGPAPAAQPSTLAQLLTPVQPARPVGEQAQPLGSTSNLRQDTASDTGTAGGTSSSGSGRDANRDGPVGALFRALASRIGRTGTTTNIKRTHAISENRTSGNSSATTNANKHDGSTHHRNQRDAKVADLNNKTQQHHGRNNRDTKAANVREAKSGRDSKSVDTRDAKIVDARDAKTTGSTSTKKDNSAKTADTRDTKSASSKGDKFAKTDNSGCVVAAKPAPGGAGTQVATKGSDGNVPKTDKVDGGTTVGPDLKKTGVTAKAAPGKGTTATEPKDPTKTDTTSATTPVSITKEPLRTQAAREAGYRDGTRAAGAVGHVQAYRDGTRDGWDDRTAANQDEKKRLDAARAHNAARPKAPAAPQMAPATGSTADLTKKDASKPADEPKPKLVVPPRPTTPPTVPAQPSKPGPAKKPPTEPKKETATTASAQASTKEKPTGDHSVDLKKPQQKPSTESQATTGTTTTAQKSQPGPDAKPGPTVAAAATSNMTTKSGPAASTAAATAVEAAVQPRPTTQKPTTTDRSPHPMNLDYAEPAYVRHVGPETVAFTLDREQHVLSRGEVRTLKGFERRMDAKKSQLANIAEGSKRTAEIAANQARSAQILMEAAKEQDLGAGLVSAIARLAEQVALLKAKAEAVERDAHRGAEAVTVVVANSDMRHGRIYQAVVDSPLTTPAERTFYQDKQGS